MKKYYSYIIIVVLAFGVIVYVPKDTSEQSSNPFGKDIVDTLDISKEYIYVDIKGEIKYPGVYKIESSYRLFQLISIAGGVTDEADTNAINMSVILYDEDIVYVPSFSDNVPAIVVEDPFDESLININTASSIILETLPGIGPSTATSIIEYRDEHGPFESIEEIMNVSGIGESTFDDIKELIKV